MHRHEFERMQCIEEGLTWATLSLVGRSENSTIGREAMLRALKKNEAEKEWIRSNCSLSEIVHSAELTLFVTIV
jgi:hypothetical protein